MDIPTVSLPTVDISDPQPEDPARYTAWVLNKAKSARPDKVNCLLELNNPKRFLKLNLKPKQGRSQNIDGIMIFLTGIEQERACTQCQNGNGVFNGCVTNKNIANGACANCAYSSHAKSCQLYSK